jgi:hypothetical protein
MWKLSQVLDAMGGEGKVEESQKLREQACEYLKISRGVEPPLDDEKAEPIFDNLVFYWSR